MLVNEIKDHNKIIRGTEKSFAIVFSIFFLILTIATFYLTGKISLIFFFISILFLFFGFIYPKIFYYPNILWFKLALLLNYIISPLIMLIIFVLAFLPTKLFTQIAKKKLLYDSFDYTKKTYWENYQKNKGNMEDQF